METADFSQAAQIYIEKCEMTANQLAVFHVLYNDLAGNISFLEIARRISNKERLSCVIGGITSQLAQDIDKIGDFQQYTQIYPTYMGWTFLFERVGTSLEGEHIKLRREFREAIDINPKFKSIMQEPLSNIFSRYERRRVYMGGIARFLDQRAKG